MDSKMFQGIQNDYNCTSAHTTEYNSYPELAVRFAFMSSSKK
jgi:hypothetical protein